MDIKLQQNFILEMDHNILSEEIVTQGDNLAMAKYAIGTRNLISKLK